MKQEHAIDLRKAAIIGCGFVGSATAFTLMQSKLFSELVLIDVDKARAEGEAMDISHGMPFTKILSRKLLTEGVVAYYSSYRIRWIY